MIPSAVDVDVVVVGGGPAGAATAGLLAKAGVDVLLLDAARFPRPKPCGECLNPGAVAALHRLGMWEAAEPLGPALIAGWRLHAGRRPVDLAFPGGATGVAVDRQRLDHALLTWAARQGARVMEGVRVTDLLIDQGQTVGVKTIPHNSAKQTIRARFTVGADGLRSVVLRRLGLLAPRAPGAPAKVAFTAHWEGIAGLTDRGELHFRGPAVIGLAPLGGGQANLTLVLPAPHARRRRPEQLLAEALRHLGLQERFAQARPTSPTLATGPFHLPVRAITAPGALLAGDAAGYYDPLTGQGIYRALRSAELAAPAILSAMHNQTPDLLHQYERQLKQEFAAGLRLQRLIDALVRRPALLGPGLNLLRLCPPAGRWLLGRVGDCPRPHDHEGSD